MRAGLPGVAGGETFSLLKGSAGKSDGPFGYAGGVPRNDTDDTLALQRGRRWSVGRSS